MASSWPDLLELKAILDVDGDGFDDHLDALRKAGIAFVKGDVGAWAEDTDVPDESLRGAALRAAVLMRPNGPEASASTAAIRADRAYAAFMFGKRRRFSIG